MYKAFTTLFILIILTGCAKEIQQTTDAATGLGALEQKLAADKDIALINAQQIYRQALLVSQDLTSGPCLSDNVAPGWVFDIVHNPRSPLDNEPAYQCPSYLDGSNKHIIEMDQFGNVIKIK